MTKSNCTMCDDTGFKDHAWLRMEPCDHQMPKTQPMQPLGEDFLSQLRRVNGARWAAWAQGDGEDPLYASNEFGGEAGEVQNEIKKLVREQRGWKGSRTTVEKLGDEVGDCIVCLDTIARAFGLDLAAVTVAKFNRTSESNGFAHRLGLPIALPNSSEIASWQPIESAPREGWHAPILTCRMGKPADWFGNEPVGGYAEPPETAYWNDAGDCWTPCHRPHDEWLPTYWMPLLSAPVKDGEEE